MQRPRFREPGAAPTNADPPRLLSPSRPAPAHPCAGSAVFLRALIVLGFCRLREPVVALKPLSSKKRTWLAAKPQKYPLWNQYQVPRAAAPVTTDLRLSTAVTPPLAGWGQKSEGRLRASGRAAGRLAPGRLCPFSQSSAAVLPAGAPLHLQCIAPGCLSPPRPPLTLRVPLPRTLVLPSGPAENPGGSPTAQPWLPRTCKAPLPRKVTPPVLRTRMWTRWGPSLASRWPSSQKRK